MKKKKKKQKTHNFLNHAGSFESDPAGRLCRRALHLPAGWWARKPEAHWHPAAAAESAAPAAGPDSAPLRPRLRSGPAPAPAPLRPRSSRIGAGKKRGALRFREKFFLKLRNLCYSLTVVYTTTIHPVLERRWAPTSPSPENLHGTFQNQLLT